LRKGSTRDPLANAAPQLESRPRFESFGCHIRRPLADTSADSELSTPKDAEERREREEQKKLEKLEKELDKHLFKIVNDTPQLLPKKPGTGFLLHDTVRMMRDNTRINALETKLKQGIAENKRLGNVILHFEGKDGEDAERWARELRYQLRHARVTPYQARLHVLNSLRGRALDFVLSQPPKMINSSVDIILTVMKHWNVFDNAGRAMEKFNKYRFREDEGARYCLYDLTNYRAKGWEYENTPTRNKAVYDKFLSLMGDTELRSYLVTKFSEGQSKKRAMPSADQLATAVAEFNCMQPSSIRKALPPPPHMATEREKPRYEQPHYSGRPNYHATGSSLRPQQAYQPNPSQGAAPNPDRNKQVQCYQCKEMGHYARECPKTKVQFVQEDQYPTDDEGYMPEYASEDELFAVAEGKKPWDGKAKEKYACRICNRYGHWKDECPQKQTSKPQRPPQDRPTQRDETKREPVAEVKELADKVNQMFKWMQEMKEARVNSVQGNEPSASGW
jgi:hypothetical protein